jgi:hypothetical protein
LSAKQSGSTQRVRFQTDATLALAAIVAKHRKYSA